MGNQLGGEEASDDCADLAATARKTAVEAFEARGESLTIAFFDLTGSSAAKIRLGNTAAIKDAIAFTTLAASICARFGGQVVKTLGDGVMAMFDDPMDGCRASLNLRLATYEHLTLQMTAGLTTGRPRRVVLHDNQPDRFDLFGDAVDRAARVQSLAVPGQVLVDGTLFNQIRADIADEPTWRVDTEPRLAHAKGIGQLQLYELCLKDQWNLRQQLATPFLVIADGRPTLSDKLALIRNAGSEIIEIGIGLTSFGKYFTGQRPEEFRDPIRKLVRGGVDLKCFALDFDYAPALAWLGEQGNPDYPDEARIARHRIEDEARACRNANYAGTVSYFTYRRIPEFWCLGVDVEDPIDGRMFYAPYLMDVARSENVIVQVSRASNTALYDKYLTSIRALRAASTEPR